ncbi:MAG: COX15/CtaA family protein, partial [Hyphomicrobiaceae bacterium]
MATITGTRGVDIRQMPADAAVRVWLTFVALLVLAMIVVGGATRLTDSGLSITEWQPLLG